MYVLGINLSHDRSAALLKDGKIVVAIAEERLDGNKRSTFYYPARKKKLSQRVPPFRAISYCLRSQGLRIDDLDLIVADNAVRAVNTESLRSILPIEDQSKIRSIPHPSHHLAHAYSAYFSSPFEESAVLVTDTFGSLTSNGTEAESGFHAVGTQLTPVLKNFQNLDVGNEPSRDTYYSLTYIYNFISLALGFCGTASREISVSEAGKTMGLAAYGNPRPEWSDIVEIAGDRIRTSGFTQWALECEIGHIEKDAMVPVPKPRRAKLNQLHKDLAFFAQSELERGILFLARRLHEITGSKNLCVAGGAGLNSIINKRILDETPFENVFIQPASTDDGTAIGCALYGWYELLRGAHRSPMKHVYLGAPCAQEDVQRALREHRIEVNALGEEELLRQTARRIAAGKIVGWVHGGSEFGPRALGHRSILADPRRPEMKDLINRKVKHRESFRPYAPSVLQEFATDYFELTCPSPYMLLVAKVKQDKREVVPAVVHADGTARVQTLSDADNGIFYRLVREFHRQTGVPVLLNTSFNTRGMPIVETPEDAIEVFLDSQMDVLVLEHFLCDKADSGTMLGLAAHHENNRHFDSALSVALKAFRRYPEDDRWYPVLAKYHHANGNYVAAIEAAERALSHNHRDERVNLYAVLGMSCEKANEFLRAVPALRQAIADEPHNEKLSASLVRCYKETGQMELMRSELARGVEVMRKKMKGFGN